MDQLLRGIWHHRIAVLTAAALLFGLGAGIVLQLPRYYAAQAVIAPAETTGIATSSLLSPTPMLGGGLLDQRQSGHFAVYLDVLRAPEAAAMLARETGLLAHLTALRQAGAMGWLRRLLGLRLEADADDAQSWLERNLAATPGIGTVTVTLTLTHREREAALDMLQRLHALAEAKVKADLVELTRRRIGFIEQRLAAERDLYVRNALYDQLGQQQRSLLVAAADQAVAARLVSAPMVGLRPAIPNRPLLLLLLAVAAPLLALFGAACWVLLAPSAAGRRLHQAELPFLYRAGAD
ncbi:hypothetical protein [Siccirubricoccus phaeus]|uniref:hypothetical protein n=1 Tax=Siccirubricoccus phaeus TaxID=2595053 RepID=UPI00165B4FEA|nr:hypothetical protein [Siccirubricoccus phaeus]